tara:strand:- start:132 stop:350 length:219 start_codon:yes stop_codon:yes gene_type:complete
MDQEQRLADERHAAVMGAIASVIKRLDELNGRTRITEVEIAVLRDRGNRANALSWSSMGSVLMAAIYWVVKR